MMSKRTNHKGSCRTLAAAAILTALTLISAAGCPGAREPVGNAEKAAEEISTEESSLEAASLESSSDSSAGSVIAVETGRMESSQKESECVHDYICMVQEEATCTEDGSLLYICRYCEDTYEETIPATGHVNLVTVKGMEATADAPGLTDGAVCADCSAVVIERELIPATD